MKTLIVPDSNTCLVDGSIVAMPRFPNMKWVLHYGWYSYKGNQQMGWYFSSIPSQTILPVTDEDLASIIVLNADPTNVCPDSGHPHCPPHHPEHHNHHHHHNDKQFTSQDKWELDRTFISVGTEAERDLLNQDRLLPDGRLVRVNKCPDGKSRYFAWNQATQTWDEASLGGSSTGNDDNHDNGGSSTSNHGYTREEADANFVSHNEFYEELMNNGGVINELIGTNYTVFSTQFEVSNLKSTVSEHETRISILEGNGGGSITPTPSSGNSITYYSPLSRSYSSFSDASWSEIVEVCNSGLAQSIYKVGDTKLTPSEDGYIVILDFNRDRLDDKYWWDSEYDTHSVANMTLGVFISGNWYHFYFPEGPNTTSWEGTPFETSINSNGHSLLSQLGIQGLQKQVYRSGSLNPNDYPYYEHRKPVYFFPLRYDDIAQPWSFDANIYRAQGGNFKLDNMTTGKVRPYQFFSNFDLGYSGTSMINITPSYSDSIYSQSVLDPDVSYGIATAHEGGMLVLKRSSEESFSSLYNYYGKFDIDYQAVDTSLGSHTVNGLAYCFCL